MSDAVVSGSPTTTPARSRGESAMDRLKTGATVLGAIAGALTGLWGFYEKVRTEARHDTAASYNTLAPQVNQLGEALKQLQQENQQLREVVAAHQKTPRLAQIPRRADKPEKPAGTAASAPAAPAGAATPPGTTPPATPGAPGAGAGPTATAPPASATPAAAGATPTIPAETPDDDPVSGLLRTVGRTRAAVESLRKVPDDFGRVLENKR